MNSCDSDCEEKKCCGRGLMVGVAVVVASLIFAVLVFKMRQYSTPEPLGAKRGEERAKALGELRAAETDALHNVGWVDQAKGTVRLPIDVAQGLALKAWQNPAAARADLIARAEKAAAPLPKAPEKPSQFE